ncbi:MAG: hypothetical protein ACTSO7_10155 [Candidatus Heimdallarchaeota archaeon]
MLNDILPNEPMFFSILMIVTIGIAVLIFIILFFITAGYGRHPNARWGLKMTTHWGWFVMEFPTIGIMFALFFLSDKWKVNDGAHWTHLAFLFIWTLHYGHRVFIYPLQIRNGKKMPLTIVLMGVLFNISNVYIQGRWIFTLSDSLPVKEFLFPMTADYSNTWLYSPQFIVGGLFFFLGYYINKRSDVMLRNLRKKSNGGGYKIPIGFLYERISCPNYLGEIMEWIGWAILTWSLAGLTFVIWTFANLLPRAISHHKWYKEEFEEYPEKRKAIIPFLL